MSTVLKINIINLSFESGKNDIITRILAYREQKDLMRNYF